MEYGTFRDYREGDRVRHKKFGWGIVDDDKIDDDLVYVYFDKLNEKGFNRVQVNIKDLRLQDGTEEYDEMYCEVCGGTACTC